MNGKAREIYQIKSEPCLIDVPAQSFIMIGGKGGDPILLTFRNELVLCYSLAYAIKMNYKKTKAADQEFTDFTVYPLEGLWRPRASRRTH